uniref:Aminopeptidase n=1 Tax=Seriola dumerili TaxID=41447 RepID=A0A3B4UNY3_SERDU
MPKQIHISQAIAATFVVLTVSAIAGLVTMIIMYQSELSTMNPTPPPTIPSTTTAPPPVMRLPKNLIPESYEVVLWPHLYTQITEVINVTSPNQTMLFTGNSTVNFHCVQRTSTIYLHSMDLNVSDAKVKDRDKNLNIAVTSMYYHEDQSDFLVVELNSALMAEGNYSLFLSFNGEISEALDGLYVSSYMEGDPDEERFLAATNIEPTLARRVFPCFDEPEMKAVFYVTIIHRQHTVALGNADICKKKLIIKKTVIMPNTIYSNLCADDFICALSTFFHDILIQTFARPEAIKAKHVDYAANITGKILTFYEKLFGIDYTQQKLDQIALPDLNPAAMENWGLITYQEGGLLYEEGVSSFLHKEVIATLIAHELAHQWFGNLVTMKWWNEIWLNEGFATYMSYFAVDHVEPSFNVKDTFVLSDLHTAFEEDALASSHPLNPPPQDIQTTFEIIEMFDPITYSKGAIVLRMLADVVDERVFNKGIRVSKNFSSHFGLAVTEDGGHTEVAKVMDTWTNQIGYPVITINTTNGEIYQKRFLFNDTSESRFVLNLWWEVPIRVMSNTTGTQLAWLRTPEIMDKFLSKHGGWILANVNCTGYYRVNYNPENWDALLTQLETNPHRIPLMNRGQLVDDAFNLARAKLLNVALALNSTRFLRSEKAYLPWESAVRNLKYFVLMFDRTEVYGPMQALKLLCFIPRHNQIIAIEVACSNGLPECVMMVQQMFAHWMNNTNIIHPNLRSVIYCQAVAYGGKAEWEFAWKKYQSSSDISEKEQLRKALSCTKTIWLLNRYLEYTLDPEKIRLMDVASTINYISENVAGQALAWNFVRGHWEYQCPNIAVSSVCVLQLERFATDYALGSATRAVYRAIEQTQVNIEWVGENKDVILEWFERQLSS